MRRVADTTVSGRSDERVATYTYDPAGRRSAKSIDGDTVVTYEYDAHGVPASNN